MVSILTIRNTQYCAQQNSRHFGYMNNRKHDILFLRRLRNRFEFPKEIVPIQNLIKAFLYGGVFREARRFGVQVIFYFFSNSLLFVSRLKSAESSLEEVWIYREPIAVVEKDNTITRKCPMHLKTGRERCGAGVPQYGQKRPLFGYVCPHFTHFIFVPSFHSGYNNCC